MTELMLTVKVGKVSRNFIALGYKREPTAYEFRVDRDLVDCSHCYWERNGSCSVLILRDWPYTPWPREGGNLLW